MAVSAGSLPPAPASPELPMPNAPKPTNASPLWRLGRGARSAIMAMALTVLMGMSAPAVVSATPQQAPNSRVVLDLPPGYTPSPLFSGFQDEASGVSYVILEAPVGEYDKMAQGFTPDELAKRGIKHVQQGQLSRTDPHVYMRAVQKSEAGLYAKYFVLF